LQRVKANKGSPGVDGMTVGGIKDYLKEHWPAIREQLLNGTYEPKPVKRVEIPNRTEGCESDLNRRVRTRTHRGVAGVGG
jgi:RNA-directed DNA polymerase